VNNQLEKIRRMKKMVTKIKEKFFLVDYQNNLFQQVHNIRKMEAFIHEYTEEFFRLSLRVGLKEPKLQYISRHVNGLKYLI
jgi:hypothetical protein